MIALWGPAKVHRFCFKDAKLPSRGSSSCLFYVFCKMFSREKIISYYLEDIAAACDIYRFIKMCMDMQCLYILNQKNCIAYSNSKC